MKDVPTLMILDDNRMMQKFLTGYFTQNYFIHSFHHVKEAWEWLDRGNYPDLIVTDIIMPDITGIEFLQQLKQNKIYRNVPVIVLSGVDKSHERVKCLELGADDFVVKPFNPKELELKIQRYIRSSNRV